MKLTIAKAIAFGKQRFHGLVESYKKVSTLPKTWFLLSIKTLKVRTISVPLMKRLFFIATVVLYIYIAIAFFVYYSIACQKHGSIAFFISIFYFCSLLRPLFFMIVVAVSLSSGFLPCKGMAVLSDTKHQAMPYSAKTFPESLPQMLHIWVFQKTFYRIVWCSDSWEPPFLYARKKAT